MTEDHGPCGSTSPRAARRSAGAPPSTSSHELRPAPRSLGCSTGRDGGHPGASLPRRPYRPRPGSVAVLVGEHHVVRRPASTSATPGGVARRTSPRTAVLSIATGRPSSLAPPDATILVGCCSTRRPSPARLALARAQGAGRRDRLCRSRGGLRHDDAIRRGAIARAARSGGVARDLPTGDGWIDRARQRRRTAAATDAIVLTDAVLAALQLWRPPRPRGRLPASWTAPLAPAPPEADIARACDRRQRRRAGGPRGRPPRIEPFAG